MCCSAKTEWPSQPAPPSKMEISPLQTDNASQRQRNDRGRLHPRPEQCNAAPGLPLLIKLYHTVKFKGTSGLSIQGFCREQQTAVAFGMTLRCLVGSSQLSAEREGRNAQNRRRCACHFKYTHCVHGEREREILRLFSQCGIWIGAPRMPFQLRYKLGVLARGCQLLVTVEKQEHLEEQLLEGAFRH